MRLTALVPVLAVAACLCACEARECVRWETKLLPNPALKLIPSPTEVCVEWAE